MKYSGFGKILLGGWVLSLLAVTGGYGQPINEEYVTETDSTVRRLTLQQALSLAEQQNYGIRQARQQIDISRAQYRKTNAAFLPRLSIEERAVTTTNPLQAFGIKLKQEMVNPSDFNPQVLNDPDRIENYSTSFQLQQPVINPEQWYRRSALDKKAKSSRQQWARTRYTVRFRIKKAYYGLILQKARISVVDTALAAARRHLKQARNYHRQGMVNKADVLSAEVRVNKLKSKRLQARHTRSNQEDRLRYLLGMRKQTDLRLTDSLGLPANPAIPDTYQQAISSRSDMQALKYRVQAARDRLSASKFQFVPAVNLFGRYEFNDNDLLGTEADNYMVGATLQWDLFSGFENIAGIQQSRHTLEKAKLAYEERTLKSETEVRKAVRQLENAREQVQLSKTTIKQAAEDLRIRANRYKEGMEKTTDLLQAEVQLEEARMRRLQALYKYNISLARLEYLLEKNL